jgi:hypothetical protein
MKALLFLAALLAMPCSSLMATTPYQLRIDVAPQPDGQLQVIGYVLAAQIETLDYRLSMEKTGKSGTSRINQGGRLRLQPGEETATSRFRFNLQPEDRYRLSLQLLKNGELVAQESLTQ